jgi:hypothetical protein
VVKHLAQRRFSSFEENLNTAKISSCVNHVPPRYQLEPTRHYAQVFPQFLQQRETSSKAWQGSSSRPRNSAGCVQCINVKE